MPNYGSRAAHFRNLPFQLVLTDHFFSIWLSLEVLLATARHARSDLEICFMDATTAFFGTYEWLVGFHRRQCIIRDPESLAK